jgi:hypothetical protein
MMPEFADFEIALSRKDVDSFMVELRYDDPAEKVIWQRVSYEVHYDPAEFRAVLLDPLAYGKKLREFLFVDPDGRSYFQQARGAAVRVSKLLRLRLFIDRSAPELHNLRWETLVNPDTETYISTDDNLLFSRFLASNQWEQITLRQQSVLRTLVVVANPTDLASGKFQVNDQTLHSVDVDGELARARQALAHTLVTEVVSDPQAPGRATLNNLIEELRKGYDILYLVCHGSILKKEPTGPYLWLEKEDGGADVRSGRDFLERIQSLRSELVPRLVVLASCQSAGETGVVQSSDPEGALAALGPRLAQAGIPAVLAMQGNISMETVARFMPEFFKTLLKDGQIDQAMAAARLAVRDRYDWWIPVLFMRLRDGRIWYKRGFSDEADEFQKWESIKRSFVDQECTAILGPGLLDSLISNQRLIARKWAEKHGYPLSNTDLEQMPRIAQYVATQNDPNFLRNVYFDAIRDELVDRYPDLFPGEKDSVSSWSRKKVAEAFRTAAAHVWTDKRPGPYQLLAKLRLPIYLTTNTGDLLSDALRQFSDKIVPQIRICPWNQFIPEEKFMFEDEPTPDRPLIYHLFGHMSEPLSLVLTEDEYFDYLIGVTANRKWIPGVVKEALASSTLLFLGFRMDDWQFRVFFRTIMAQGGKQRLSNYSHAAAQLVPEEDRIRDAERARRYLEQYFKGELINLYWGNSDDFLNDLLERMGTVDRLEARQ